MRTALGIFLIAAAAWGQNDTSASAEKVDRAAAYYHYALAHYYRTTAGQGPGNVEKSIENYKAAVKADPRTPLMLSPGPAFIPIFPGIPRRPASRQVQPAP
jgi:hypothetical protein